VITAEFTKEGEKGYPLIVHLEGKKEERSTPVMRKEGEED